MIQYSVCPRSDIIFECNEFMDPVMSVCLCSDIIFECDEFMTKL